MEVAKVRIQSIEDAQNGIPIVENSTGVPEKSKDFTVGILEGGTVQGRTSLMFICQDKNGKSVFGEMTGKQFEMLYQAYKGAVERFGK